MQNKILNGKLLAKEILDKVGVSIQNIQNTGKRSPCLVVILVGDDPASAVYVRNKKNACTKVGIKSIEFVLPSSILDTELHELIQQLNLDHNVDGILLQLPLPANLDAKCLIDSISPQKDVDGFSRQNMGALALNNPEICPCTPHGIMYILDSIPEISYYGKNVVILGSSTIVGRPMALELINRGATVTICNSKTRNLNEVVSRADILVVAVGKANFVQGTWLKKGCIVIDVGINRLADGSLCGDVDFNSAIDIASYITPVPGGVGPMTIAMLIQNTLSCYKIIHNLSGIY